MRVSFYRLALSHAPARRAMASWRAGLSQLPFRHAPRSDRPMPMPQVCSTHRVDRPVRAGLRGIPMHRPDRRRRGAIWSNPSRLAGIWLPAVALTKLRLTRQGSDPLPAGPRFEAKSPSARREGAGISVICSCAGLRLKPSRRCDGAFGSNRFATPKWLPSRRDPRLQRQPAFAARGSHRYFRHFGASGLLVMGPNPSRAR